MLGLGDAGGYCPKPMLARGRVRMSQNAPDRLSILIEDLIIVFELAVAKVSRFEGEHSDATRGMIPAHLNHLSGIVNVGLAIPELIGSTVANREFLVALGGEADMTPAS
jgi:hypothetical protein